MPVYNKVVVLTGAGVSAESGLPTFRDANGLWEGHRVEEVATPEAFERNAALVHRFYNLRRRALLAVQPNAAHLALARLERELQGSLTLITQNVDDLHERGGSRSVLHMHGELRKARCVFCGSVFDWDEDLEQATVCPSCGRSTGMRPHIVWFGEMPMRMAEIEQALADADLFVALGTSGNVYPAAGFVRIVSQNGADTVEINNAATEVSHHFGVRITGPASLTVPEFVESVLSGKRWK